MQKPFQLSPHACRSCNTALTQSVVDLGVMPLANSYIPKAHFYDSEPHFPLHAYVCTSCWLTQIPAVETPMDIFSEYAYFSGFSTTWQAHCAEYAPQMIQQLKLDATSQVIEIASNDGTLLQPFQAAGIPVLGIEPARNIAEHANHKGIPTRNAFFGKATAEVLAAEGLQADLIAANNVLAHVPDIHDFMSGFTALLKPNGTITFEFPHVLELLKHTQFDTIYHEHFSYLSLTALMPVFAQHGLQAVDVQTLPTHGGSLRVYVHHAHTEQSQESITTLLSAEKEAGLQNIATYTVFSERVRTLKWNLLSILHTLRSEGKRIAAYGAPAKGNTLLNYCGIGSDLIAYTVDRNPEKQRSFLPGSRLPIYAPEYMLEDRPDIVLILPWNIAAEIVEQMKDLHQTGTQFMVAVPEVQVI